MFDARELRAAIVKAGYTQATLSKELEMSENSLSSKMQGKRKFYIEEAAKICEILQINDIETRAKIFLI